MTASKANPIEKAMLEGKHHLIIEIDSLIIEQMMKLCQPTTISIIMIL